jgi:hypothetical protein
MRQPLWQAGATSRLASGNHQGRGQPVKMSWHCAGNPISDTDIGDCD